MKRKTWSLFMAFVGTACLYSCSHDRTVIPPAINCTGVVDTANTYTNNISNIMTNYSCTSPSCHGGGSAQDGVDLTTYQGTVTAFQTQNLICAVTSPNCGGIQMPSGMRPLDSIVIKQLQCWQANGFPK